MDVIKYLLYIFVQIIVHSRAEEIIINGFLDLYKPEYKVDSLFNENPICPGFECGPGAFVALDKVHESFAGETYGTNLKLLTFADIDLDDWDRIQGAARLKRSQYIECGDEWKTGRCLERLEEQNKTPMLIIGSHRDLSSQTSALHSFIEQSMFVSTVQLLEGQSPVNGNQKSIKGWGNTIRFDPSVSYINLREFMNTFGWKKHLTVFHEIYEASYRAASFFDEMNDQSDVNLLENSKLKALTMYPVSLYNELKGDWQILSARLWEEKLENYKNISDNYFKGDAIKTRSRIVLLFGSQRMVRDMMLQAFDAGMTQSNDYVFIIVPTNYFPLYTWEGADDELFYDESQKGKDRDEDAHKAFQSAFIVTAEINTTSFESFSENVKERAKEVPFNYTFPPNRKLPLYAANYHDAVLLWAYAIKHHYDPEKKGLQVEELYNKTFTKEHFNGIEPITGNIKLDANGDRENSFLFWHLDNNGEWEKVGQYVNDKYEVLVNEADIAWPNAAKSAPQAEPECGFTGENCDNTLTIAIGATTGAVAILVSGLAVMIYMYRKVTYEAALAAMSWRIPINSVRDVARDPLGSSVFGSRRSMLATPDSSLSSQSTNMKGKTQQFFSRRGQYENKIVALKTVLPQYMNITRELMVQMKTLKDLRNENLLTVFGAIIERDISYLVTEYCSKGSLQDILENDDVKLDDMLKFSLINDLAQGLKYIHESVIESHGYLKSSNCIINNQFALKISDFSKTIFMSDMERLSRATEEAMNERLVYRAPELLRMSCVPCQGTREGDIYSFGIVLHEILVREGPFGLSSMQSDLTATEVICMIRKTGTTTPYRPEFPFSTDLKIATVSALSRDCWKEDPYQRPTIQIIRSSLRSIRTEGSSGGIVENLLSRMEKYATNLEDVVEERTAQLQVEKKRTDDLLESMLPKSVADQLKSGNMPPPEWFECVSIYFSDIVGFTAISSGSKPIEVLDMLNDLYTLLDTCIEKYDCYKVETIGDAYMVVSGLPIRNGERHAAQIGLMSLDFLDNVNNFVIGHLPNEKIKIRIGMHSGPVVAGIVGKKMPRYCLFGDTVNTASRMESNGEALKIQMSEQSYKILDNHGGFIIEARGLIEMKGKGLVQTYWLQGVDKALNLTNPRQFTDQTTQLKKKVALEKSLNNSQNNLNNKVDNKPILNNNNIHV